MVDVHGQNEHQHILKPAVQLSLLDRFAHLEEKREAIEPLYRVWTELRQKLNEKNLSEEERLQRIDVYRFQLQEIENAKLQPQEEDELSQRLPELRNADKLRTLGEMAYGALYQEDGSALERLGQAEKAFDQLRQISPLVDPLLQEFTDAKLHLEEVAHNLKGMSERWETDPEALEAAITRLDQISRLKKKYGGSVDAVIQQGHHLKIELDRLENADLYRHELEKQVQKAEGDLKKAASDLSSKRSKAAKELGAAVKKELGDLDLKQAIFQCRVEGIPGGGFNTTGMDHVAFEWSPNPGEGIQPLKAIASGGEMSRVMLALKSILADADSVPSLVFDEIDAGIGGLTAQSVGKKLRNLAKHHQILCVSHLPQIASCASTHFQVSKRIAKSRTFAVIVRLDPSERVSELARLLGSDVTPTSVQHAKELLSQNQ